MRSVLEELAAGGMRRLWALEELATVPSRDASVADVLEALLNDPSPCRVGPFHIGEVRLLAALALAAHRRAASPLRICAIRPLTVGALISVLEQAQLPWPPAIDQDDPAGTVAAFTLARDHGLLHEELIEIDKQATVDSIASSVPFPGEKEPAETATVPAPPPRTASPEDVAFHLDVLQHGDLDRRVFTLQSIASTPTADPRVRQALEPLLDDATPCLLQIPYRFGELRLLAALALASERRAIGDQRPVTVSAAAPLSPDDLGLLAERNGLALNETVPDPVAAQLDLYARLRDAAAIPSAEATFGPMPK